MGQSLNGVRVLDLGQIYNGSYCGLLLGYMGAEVIKIEPPGGENLRARSQGEAADSHAFTMLNSNKKGIVINLKHPRGRELLLQLIKRADVLLENFAVGVMEGFGLGYEDVKEINPRLVYARGKGFGLTGPYSKFLAMDLTVQAMSGTMSVTGFPDGPPTKCGPPFADFMGGIHLYAGIVTALFQRVKTGQGQLVEVSMHDTIYPALASQLEAYYRFDATLPERTGNQHGGLRMSPYNVYKVKDGYISIICVNNRHWESICKVIGREDLGRDPRFDSNPKRAKYMDLIDGLVSQWAAPFARDEIQKVLNEAHVPCAAILKMSEVVNDPHYLARGMIIEIEHPVKGKIPVPGTPIRLSDSEFCTPVAAPLLGQHTLEVLSNVLSFSDQEIEVLRGEGVIS